MGTSELPDNWMPPLYGDRTLSDFAAFFYSTPPRSQDDRKIVWTRKRKLNELYNLFNTMVLKPFLRQAQNNDLGDRADREEAVNKFIDKFLCISMEASHFLLFWQMIISAQSQSRAAEIEIIFFLGILKSGMIRQQIPYFFARFDPTSGCSWINWGFRQLDSLKIDAYRKRTRSRSTKAQLDKLAKILPAELSVEEFKLQEKKLPLSLDSPRIVDGSALTWEVADPTQSRSCFDAIDYAANEAWQTDFHYCIDCDAEIADIQKADLVEIIQQLRQCHPRPYPQCNAQYIIRQFLIDPSISTSQIAKQLEIPQKNVSTIREYPDKSRALAAKIVDILTQKHGIEIEIDSQYRTLPRKHKSAESITKS